MPSIITAARANALLAPLGVAVSAVATVVIVRSLRPSLYADYMSVVAIILTATLLAEGGVGLSLMRYIREMDAVRAARSLLVLMVRRRAISAFVAAAGILGLGPLWARLSGLDPATWSIALFGAIALGAVAALLQALPYYALLGLYRHAEAGIALQVSNLVRAAAVAAAAVSGADLLTLTLIYASVSVATCAWLSFRITRVVAGQTNAVPDDAISDSRRYGLASTFDKIATWAGGTAVLLLLLAPFFSREALATLAIAGDVVQKALVVASLPLSNIVIPYLSRASGDGEALASATTRATRAASLVFIPVLAGLIAVAPVAVPFVFGAQYAAAVPLLTIIAVPAFAESLVRFVLLPALLTGRHYRALVILNAFEICAVLAISACGAFLTMPQLLLAIAVTKLLYVAAVIVSAARAAVITGPLLPRGLVPAAAAAAVLAAVAGSVAEGDAQATLIGATVFALTLPIAMRLLLRLDADLGATLRRAIGTRFSFMLDWFARC